MHKLEEVLQRDMCIGCGACAFATRGEILLRPREDGLYSADTSLAGEAAIRVGSQVCPFSDESLDEHQISGRVFSEREMSATGGLGAHLAVGVARRTDDKEVAKSSSGGATSWLLQEMLSQGVVDCVLHVAGNADPSRPLFDYVNTSEGDEIGGRRKSQYYPATMVDALELVRSEPGTKFALVGVPCFIRAARLISLRDPIVARGIRHYVSLVCGHMKNRYFAEALAWQVGVAPEEVAAVDFRVKVSGRSASDYDFQTTATDGSVHSGRTRNLLGGNWGHAAFQPEACNFCDDVYGETADVTFGDAWLPEYSTDWRGHNIVVCRDPRLLELLEQGSERGELFWKAVGPEAALEAQSGAFRHRVEGMKVRLHDDRAAGLSVPRKRHEPEVDHVSARRAALVRQRRRMSARSTEVFARAKQLGSLDYFLVEMAGDVRKYSRIDTPILRRAARATKAALRKLQGLGNWG